jgi:hypothetical protein
MSKDAAKNSQGTLKRAAANFVAGTDYGIRRTAKGDWYVWKETRDGWRWVRADKKEVKDHLDIVHDIVDVAPPRGTV